MARSQAVQHEQQKAASARRRLPSFVAADAAGKSKSDTQPSQNTGCF
jgi:hypothetical protein